MVSLSSMSSRGAALARTFASAFSALIEHAKTHGAEVEAIAGAVAAHLKSWAPLSIKAECECMRPIYVLALAFVDAEHVRNANCSAGDHDECPAREAEIALREAVAKHEGADV